MLCETGLEFPYQPYLSRFARFLMSGWLAVLSDVAQRLLRLRSVAVTMPCWLVVPADVAQQLLRLRSVAATMPCWLAVLADVAQRLLRLRSVAVTMPGWLAVLADVALTDSMIRPVSGWISPSLWRSRGLANDFLWHREKPSEFVKRLTRNLLILRPEFRKWWRVRSVASAWGKRFRLESVEQRYRGVRAAMPVGRVAVARSEAAVRFRESIAKLPGWQEPPSVQSREVRVSGRSSLNPFLPIRCRDSG
jgi:hypothetical protein